MQPEVRSPEAAAADLGETIRQRTALLGQWRNLTEQWWQRPDPLASPEALLTGAFDALDAAVPLLRRAGFPEDTDPLELASDAFTYRQTRSHLRTATELVRLAIDFEACRWWPLEPWATPSSKGRVLARRRHPC